ncbi:hypothetical protein GR268_47215, partial [Rhizobium leguminosarum]|nr:hypothetical protein [Rhizobium leguminosarum]
MEKGKFLSTPILDMPGEIGPFFFKEAFFIFLGCVLLFLFMLIVALFVQISGFMLAAVPGTFVLVMSLLRFVFIKKIDSPWYIHKWIAYRFLIPKNI